MKINRKVGLSLLILSLVLGYFLPLAARVPEPGTYIEKAEQVSDHFDGIRYFNPHTPQAVPSPPGQAARWIWNWIFRTDRPKWPKQTDFLPGAPPVARAPESSLYVTPVGHGTFLIQLDGVNILTDPIWSERCSPLSWVGPKRNHEPGIRFEDLPPIDVVLVSHNHYDHLDLPTLERLANKGMPRAIVPLGNLDLMRSSGIPTVDELDWMAVGPFVFKRDDNPGSCAALFVAHPMGSKSIPLGRFCHLRAIRERFLFWGHGIWSPFPRDRSPFFTDQGGTSSDRSLQAAEGRGDNSGISSRYPYGTG